jgi:hypothetical protein
LVVTSFWFGDAEGILEDWAGKPALMKIFCIVWPAAVARACVWPVGTDDRVEGSGFALNGVQRLKLLTRCRLLQDQKVGYTDYPFLDDSLVCELEKKLKT